MPEAVILLTAECGLMLRAVDTVERVTRPADARARRILMRRPPAMRHYADAA